MCVCVYTWNCTQCKPEDETAAGEENEAEADKENEAEAMRCIQAYRKDNEVTPASVAVRVVQTQGHAYLRTCIPSCLPRALMHTDIHAQACTRSLYACSCSS